MTPRKPPGEDRTTRRSPSESDPQAGPPVRLRMADNYQSTPLMLIYFVSICHSYYDRKF